MTEVTNELMYEVLKTIQYRLDKIEAGIDELRQGHNAMRGHMISIQTDVHNIYGILGRHDERLERIGKRLELYELAEPQGSYRPE